MTYLKSHTICYCSLARVAAESFFRAMSNPLNSTVPKISDRQYTSQETNSYWLACVAST
jgi:hypothetical protein